MKNFVIGIDPDVKKSGIAIFENKKLVELKNLSLTDFYMFCENIVEHFDYCSDELDKPTFVIEDGNIISGLYNRNKNNNNLVQHKISEHVGANKQRAKDLIEIAEFFGIKTIRQKPRKGNWSDKKAMFESVTGWKGRSNPETRSAAFFGYFFATTNKTI